MSKIKLFIVGLILMIGLTSLEVNAETYAVVAETRNNIGTNYSINLHVNGNCFYNTCSVSSVSYWNGSFWQNVSFNYAIGISGLYYVNIGYQTYYFEF